VWLLKGFGLGGAERLLLEVLPWLDGVEVLPVAVDPRVTDLEPALRAAGLSPRSLGATTDADPSWIPRLRALLREVRADVVHVHHPLPGAGARIAALGTGVPVVYVEQGRWAAYHPASRIVNALTMPLDAVSVAVSEEVRASALRDPIGRFTARRFEVIQNGIDAHAVRRDAAPPPEPPVDLDGPTITAVTHLTPPKGVDTLILAASIARARGRATPVVIVGDGPLGPGLRTLAEDHGVGGDVRFLGVRADARSIMARSSVIVLPSRSEGLPLALLEAMALGRPIVATRVGGVPEAVVDEEEALLVPPDQPATLAGAIARLLDDPAMAASLGAAAQARVERDHSAQLCAQRLRRVYARVVRGGR
jgi:glycosyltransferase involved in cell wall biosynthesis